MSVLSDERLCLGTMYFGTTVDEDRSRAILDRFVERGGRLIDTANCYCFWTDGGTGDESEALIGRWLADRGNRDAVLLATKVGSRPVGPGDWPATAEGLRPDVIRDGVAGSLERLGTDRVDLYMSHLDDPRSDLTATLAAFAELVDAGAVTMLGASNLTTARLREAVAIADAHGWPAYEVVQSRHTYLRPQPGVDIGPQRSVDEELLAYARLRPLLLQGYSPLLGGAYGQPDRPLAPEYRGPDTARRLATLRRVAERLGISANQLVLALMMAGDAPVMPVLGVSSVGQLDEAMDALDVRLDPATLDELAR
jgi:aryl-alcohol dehydrogenase-like predicted oxidoreductase